jgi:site-specific DNA-methyltransferase (adenine-specific)
MTVNIEDAGFEIRDQIMWLYGSGFPKSHNISKAIDKVEGNERKVIGKKIQRVDGTLRNQQPNGGFMKENVITKKSDGYIDVEEPGSDNSKKYNGWGTALKPANEPICVARKPLSEKSVAENVLKWGTGGINVDGCRVEGAYGSGQNEVIEGKEAGQMYHRHENGMEGNNYKQKIMVSNPEGRFPANIILDEIAAELLDEQSGITASRFFYQAKVNKGERNMSLDIKNNHPTIKPVALMTYLCRLITPKNGIILDPFMGSGSTGIAAQLEGFRFVGMEMDEDYFKIAEARIENFESYRKFQKNNN